MNQMPSPRKTPQEKRKNISGPYIRLFSGYNTKHILYIIHPLQSSKIAAEKYRRKTIFRSPYQNIFYLIQNIFYISYTDAKYRKKTIFRPPYQKIFWLIQNIFYISYTNAVLENRRGKIPQENNF